MRKVIAVTNLSLDGVMQAPGRPDEDRRSGFTRGGWAVPYAAMQEAGESMSNMGALLFGRWTYESFAAFWPKQINNPFTAMLDNMQKYVASKTLKEPLAWRNTTLLPGDAAETVAKLKQEEGKDIVIFGSGVLIQSLMRHGLIDEYALLFHPLVLGTGRRLFADESIFTNLRLVNAKTTAKGVVSAIYRPANGDLPVG